MGMGIFTNVKRDFRKSQLFFLLVFLGLSVAVQSRGEGTRELLVNFESTPRFDTTKSTFYSNGKVNDATNVVQVWDQGPSPGGIGRATGTYTSINPANEKYRIKIRVCKPGEVINIGFHPSKNSLTYWRLYKEDGTCIRFNGTNGAITNLSALGGGTETVNGTNYTYRVPRNIAGEVNQPGHIAWYSQAAVGPLPTCSTVAAGGLGVGYPAGTYCGYRPIQYVVQPGDIGPNGFADFFIVFNGDDPNNLRNTVNRHLAMFDVTVWDSNTPAPIVRKGRLYSAAWDINCNGSSTPRHTFNSKLYFYSKDSVVTAVTFNQMRPWGFIISANATGTSNTGNTDFDRRSRLQFHGAPDYPIFLNNPYNSSSDHTCGIDPKPSFGQIISATITGCDDNRCINILADRTGTVGITLYPENPGDFVPRVFNNTTLEGNVSTCLPWDGLDGAGNPIIGEFNVQVNYFNGLTNLPLYDVEDHPFGYIIELVAPPPSTPVPGGSVAPIMVYWDDRPHPAFGTPEFTAGQAWDGLWDNDNNPLTPDIPVGYHGLDPVLPFRSNSTYNLLGCDPSIDQSASTPGMQGCHLWVGRGLNSACPGWPGGNCAETHNTWWNANVQTIRVNYSTSNVRVYSDVDAAPAPIGTGNANARVKNVCSNVSPIPIHGVVIRAPKIESQADVDDMSKYVDYTGTWELIPGFASGSLASPANQLINGYIPTAADFARGYVLLGIVSDVNPTLVPCGIARDTLRINLFEGPEVFVREPVTVCAGNTTIQLNPGVAPNISGVNSVVRTFGWFPIHDGQPLVGGTFVPNNQSLSTVATYTPPASFTTGTIILRLKSLTTHLPVGVNCPADSADLVITVNELPAVEALDTLKVCNTGAGVTVAIPAGQATINGAPTIPAGYTVNWTGAGTFTGANTLTPVYTPTTAERTAGILKINFRVTRNTPDACAEVQDTLIIQLVAPPTAQAGDPQTLCSNNVSTIDLTGRVTNASSISWSSTAAGSFAPADNDTTVFTPSAAPSGPITFTITAESSLASCPDATSNVTFNFVEPVELVLPTSLQYCRETPTVNLSVTSTPPSVEGEWFANREGTAKPLGVFVPNDRDPSAQYTLAAQETLFPTGLYFIVPANGNCAAVVDSVVLLPASRPVVTLTDRSVCENVTTISISGTFITNPPFNASTIQWRSLGTAQNFSSVNTQSTVFTPTNADKSNGSVKLVLSVEGNSPPTCPIVADTMTITFTPAPTVSAGSNQVACENNPSIALAGVVSNDATSYVWTTSEPGSFGGTENTQNATFTPSSPGSPITFTLTATKTGCNPVAAQTQVTFTDAPTATISTAPGSVCANNPVLTLSATSSTGALHWRSSSNCVSCFSDTNAIAPATVTYTPSATDLANGSVSFTVATRENGNCVSEVSETVTFTFTASPGISITTPAPVCENNATISLSGTVNGASGGTWTSSSGCITCFDDPNSLTTTYNPSATDINNGSVTFTLVSTGNVSNCLSEEATATAIINKAPVLTEGPDLTICSNLNTVALTGASASNHSSILWSIKEDAGTGSISNATSLTGAIYNISAQDKEDGTVIIVLTANGQAGCASISQERVIQFTPIPRVNLGPDRTVCMNDTPVLLDGVGNSGGTWTCNTCTITNISDLGAINPTYAAVAGDVNTTITFTYSIPASAGCPGVSDDVAITFAPAPQVNIGGPYTLCGNTASIALNASVVQAATGLIWTTSGTGSFGDEINPVTYYTPSQADTAAGHVTLRVLSTGNGICSPDSASTVLTITKPISVNAGVDQNICFEAGNTISLSALVQNGTFDRWTIAGAHTGSLTNATANPTTYTMGAGDAGNTIVFIAHSATTAACTNPITDTVRYTFIAAPTVAISTAPLDACQDEAIELVGNIAGANAGIWECINCTGTGSFSPDNTYNNLLPQTTVHYTPSPADTAQASLQFRLTSTAAHVCGAVSSSVATVNLEKKPRVNAGPDMVLCANNNVYTLQGSMVNSATGVWKSGENKFTGFAPSNAFPAALTYDPDTLEVQSGFVTLTLFSTGTVACPSDSDKVTITFSEAPLANAGFDRTICENNPSVALVGTINNPGLFTPSWSSEYCGTTCFSDPTTLLTTYTANATDTTHASINLYLTALDPTGLCLPHVDTVVLNILDEPRVEITTNLGNNFQICSDSAFVVLRGTSSTGALRWTTNGSGIFQASAFETDSVLYPFTNLDRLRANQPAPNNTIEFYLQSEGGGACLPVFDTIAVTLTPRPVVEITTGDSISICASENTIELRSSVSPSDFDIDWTTSGSGTFNPDYPTTPANNTTYTLTALDKTAGSIVLVAHTVSPAGSSCRSVTDQIRVHIQPLPVINLGPNLTVCQDVTEIDLSGATVTNATSVQWSTSGTGVFGPNASSLGANTVYYPSYLLTSNNDVDQPFITLSLSAIGCSTIQASKTIHFTPQPLVEAGTYPEVCFETNSIVLSNASASQHNGVRWTRISPAGGGTFTNANVLNATYNFNAADRAAGKVVLVLTAQGNGACGPKTDTVEIDILRDPVIEVGPNASLCSKTLSESLVYTISTISITNGITPTWTTTGTTTNLDILNPLSPTYYITQDDIDNGSVTIRATTRAKAGCRAVSDAMTINISKAPTLELGPDINICANLGTAIQLSSTSTYSSGTPVWYSNAGGFFDDPNATAPYYTPTSTEDDANNSTIVYATISGQGSCPPATDSVQINFTDNPVLADLPDMTFCFPNGAANYTINLNAGIVGTWASSEGGGTFSANPSANPVYTSPSPSAGVINITFVPSDACYLAQTADAAITMVVAPSTNATSPLDVCDNNFGAALNLAANAANNGTVLWQTIQGFGTIASPTSANTTYTLNPDSSDFSLSEILLKVTVQGTNIACAPAEDTVVIHPHRAPQVGSSDQIVCEDLLNVANAISLDGSISTGFTSNWTNTNNLTVSNPTSLNTTATITGFPASIRLQATGLHASCAPVFTDVQFTEQPTPVVTVVTSNIPACIRPGELIDLSGSITVSGTTPNGGFWSKATASPGGAFSPNAIGHTGISYTPSANDFTLPAVVLRYTITDKGVCTNNYTGDVQIDFSNQRSVEAVAPSITFCAQDNAVHLEAIATPAPPTTALTWSILNGSGAFVGGTTDELAVYDPSTADVSNGGAILMVKTTNNAAIGCPEDSALVSLTLVPEPMAFVNAGVNQRLCVDNPYAQLQGIILNASGGVWRKKSAALDGYFSDSTDLEARYYFGQNDTAQSSIILYLVSVGGNVLCNQVMDSVEIIFTPIPVPNATTSAPVVCEDVDFIPLSGTVAVTSVNQGVWSSSGDGYFTQVNEYDLTPVYVPGPKDKQAGQAIFTFTSTNNGNCQAYHDTTRTIINKKIWADAGPNQQICANTGQGVTFVAIAEPTNTNVWTVNPPSLGTDLTMVAPENLQMTYVPDSLDIYIHEMVSFKFKTSGGGCKDDSAQVLLKIVPAPYVEVGPDQTICADALGVDVFVQQIDLATQGVWTSSGTGRFDNPTALTTVYRLSEADRDSSSIVLFFTTTDNLSSGSMCNPVTDALVINITPRPVVTASATNTCVTTSGILLSGSVTHSGNPGASGVWTTNSLGIPGSFSVDPYTLNATYFPSSSDISRGNVTLTLSSENAGTCRAVRKSVTLNVSPTPMADAGKDLFVCQGNNVTLKANPQPNLVQYDWSISGGVSVGTGLEVSAGPVNVHTDYVLTVTDNKGCSNTDTVRVNAVADPMITQDNQQCYDYHGYITANIGGTVSPLGTYQWYFNSTLVSGENRNYTRIVQPGFYQVVYSIGACSRISNEATNVLDLPRIMTQDIVGCQDSIVNVTLREMPNKQLASMGLMPYDYTWTPVGSTTNTNPAELRTSPTAVDTLVYYVTSSYTTTVLPALTCSYSDSVRVISIPRPAPGLIDSVQACENQFVELNANVPPSNLPALTAFNPTVEWYAENAPTTILGTGYTYSPTRTNNYVVKATIGQCTGLDTSNVTFRPYPTKVLPDELNKCFEQVRFVTLDAGPGGENVLGLTTVTYQWFADDRLLVGQTGRTTPVTYEMIENEADEALLMTVNIANVYNTLICPTTDTILVQDVCVPRVFPPTAFHPGDDNPIDAEFTIKGKYYRNYKITIFNRWGEIVFYSEDPNKHWDGTYRGEVMPVGVYAYIISYEGKDELNKGPFKKEGRVVLVR
jgi:gliding motility-associated-like protein